MDKVRRLLTADWIYRKQCKWPLLKWDDNIKSFYNTEAKIFSQAVHNPYLPIIPKPRKCNAVQELYIEFPRLQAILCKYKGKIAVCGGGVASMVADKVPHKDWGHMDADIFFYGISKEEATEILFDCIDMLVTNYPYDENPETTIRVEHRKKITNVVLVPNIGKYRVYQFVHRIYPTLDSILGGFDIGLSMLAFDGDDIWATPLGAECVQDNMIIVDTTRRSTSYEYRILKYYRRFQSNVIFPGLDMDNLRILTNESKQEVSEESMNKINMLLKELNVRISYEARNALSDNNGVQVINDQQFFEPEPFNVRFNDIRLSPPPGNTERGVHLGNSNQSLAKRYRGDEFNAINEAYLIRYSDYSDSRIFDHLIPAANGSMLRCSNIDGVMVTISFNSSKKGNWQTNLPAIKYLYDNPIVVFDVDFYKKRVRIFQKRGYDRTMTRARITTLADHSYEEDVEQNLSYIQSQLINRMHLNAKRAEANLKGVDWITDNPQRQWTSSNNPIIENPRDFYGEHYVRFTIGIPEEIESTLRWMRLRRECIWSTIPTDVFRLLLSYIVRNYM